jgi:hypothetical protein
MAARETGHLVGPEFRAPQYTAVGHVDRRWAGESENTQLAFRAIVDTIATSITAFD